MHLLRKSLALLTAVLCLGLTSCGGSDDPDVIAGDDWRTTGVVADSGTITHDGDSVDVLVTVDENSAAFYWDQPEQVLFDSVSFPMTIPDAKQAFSGIFFDDLDGDGESDVTVRFLHENNDVTEMVWIWDPEERYVFREDLSTVTIGGNTDENDKESLLSAYVGLWEYVGENLWLRIHEDATWEFVNDQDETIDYGALWIDETGITLHFDGSGDVLQLDFANSGDLLDGVNGGTLVPVEAIESQAPYFARNGIEINAAVNEGTYLLENGACSYYNLGEGYGTGDCYWEVVKNGDYTHDGIREIQFDAICYIPHSSNPYSNQQGTVVTDSELYDFNTGMWLTSSTTYGNSSRGDNYYLHTVNWNGQSDLIEFAYSIDWQYNVSDWSMVLTKSYTVYLPEDYDGLVFAAESQPDNYKDSAKRMQMDSISPEASILDIDTVDPYSSLFFSICG